MMHGIQKRIRGRIILGYFNYIIWKWGKLGVDAAQKELKMEMADIAANKWYPYSHAESIVAWLGENHSMTDVRSAGAYLVSESGVIMAYAKGKDLDSVLRSISEARENSNFGSLDIRKEPWGVKVTVKGFCSTEEMCESWHGTLEGVIKMMDIGARVERLPSDREEDGACSFKVLLDG
jgi:hypothetical protein